jgi:hypothetical protein
MALEDRKVDYEKLGVFYLGKEFDPAAGKLADAPLLYDSRSLTTHAVCLGMTGSGKTGLCISLLEEAAIDGIPALCIDPKGDLGNLLLNFPALAPRDFEPWVDPGEAARKGVSVTDFAAQTAQKWREGLAEWDQQPERIQRLRDAADIAIYTPGSNAGLPLSVLRSFAAPPAAVLQDATALAERIAGVTSGLLTLIGRDADPLTSREHILIANLLDQSWRAGQNLDLAGLVAAVQKPPLTKLGALDLETFFPAKERLGLAMAINALLASPSFAAWTRGEPLDVQRLLFTPEGKPRIAIVSIAHLSDAERMFVVTLLLHEVVAWMRRQSGTTSLRALLYMDEVFGFFPPSANPPAKQPMLTLLKQARAFGLGVVLATQNPVDLDYKGLGNTGTWFIGRLQTERDRDRVLDGLTSALASVAVERSELAKLLSSLTPRVFMMRSPQDDAPILMKSRWALSYLRGPLTPAEISKVMAPRRTAPADVGVLPLGATPQAAAAASAPATASRPALPAEIDEAFLPARPGSGGIHYKPRIVGQVKLHYADATLKVDSWQDRGLVAALDDEGREALWSEAEPLPVEPAALERQPANGASFAELPAGALRGSSYAAFGKALGTLLYQSARARLLVCDAAKLVSQPDETEGDFRTRVALALREQRDERAATLRAKYAPKLETLRASMQRATQKADRERSQLNQQRLQTAINVGATVLGALFGRKAVSTATLGRASTAARSAGRLGRESQDVDHADESLQQVEARMTALTQECEEAVKALETSLDPATVALREVQLAPRKSDIQVGRISLLWLPWRMGSDGFLKQAW